MSWRSAKTFQYWRLLLDISEAYTEQGFSQAKTAGARTSSPQVPRPCVVGLRLREASSSPHRASAFRCTKRAAVSASAFSLRRSLHSSSLMRFASAELAWSAELPGASAAGALAPRLGIHPPNRRANRPIIQFQVNF